MSQEGEKNEDKEVYVYGAYTFTDFRCRLW